MKCSALGEHIHNTSFSLFLINSPVKLEYYITRGWKGLRDSLLRPFLSYIEKMNCKFGLRYLIHNTSFSLLLINSLDKPEYYITRGWKGLTETNAVTYWGHS